MEETLLKLIAGALDLIHKEMVMRNAYDVGIISKEHYEDYLKMFLFIPNKESSDAENGTSSD